MKCTKCGRENDENMKFCGECGAKLDETLQTDSEEIKEEYSNNIDNVFTQENQDVVEMKTKNKKTKLVISIVAIIVALACVFSMFGSRSKINGVSADTYKACTKIMKKLSNETYINEIANRVEVGIYQEFGDEWSSLPMSEIYDFVWHDYTVVELVDDLVDIPLTTEADKTLRFFVMSQYGLFIEEAMDRACGASTFVIGGMYYSSTTDSGYSYEDFQDIYGTFILKYDSIYNTANDIEDLNEALDEMYIIIPFTGMPIEE